MATPAASAWHRRRILSDKTPRLSVAASSAGFTEGGLSQAGASSRQSLDTRTNGYRHSMGARSSAPTAGLDSSSLYRRLPMAAAAAAAAIGETATTTGTTSPAPSGASVRRALHGLIEPFMSFAHSSSLQIFIAVAVALLIAHVLRAFLMSTLGVLFLRCDVKPPALSSAVSLLSAPLFAMLVAIQVATHFIFSRSLRDTPPAKGTFLFVAMVTIPIHALVFAYLLYGPTLSPHQFFCTAPDSVVPARNAVHMITATAFLYAPALCACVFYLRAYSPPPFPFARSATRRVLAALPHALGVVSLPALPVIPFAIAIAAATRPTRPLYESLLLMMARTGGAIYATVAASLPHALLRVAEATRGGHGGVGDGMMGIGTGGDAAARDALVSAPSAAAVRHALVALCSAPRAHMLPFSPFTDPSGRQWRVALDAALAPAASVLSRVHGVRHAPHAALHTGMMAGGVPRSDTTLTVSDSTLREAAAVARVLPAAFEASVQHDAFGVVLPTLPHALALLVLLHEGLCTAIAAYGDASRSSWLFSTRYAGVAGLIQAVAASFADSVDRRSQLAALRSLKDVVSVCVYRLVFVFKEEVFRFTEGHEPGWDTQATEALRPFTLFEV